MSYVRRLLADRDGKPSVVRHIALLLVPLAYLAVTLGRSAATVAAIIGGGVVALLTRKQDAA